MREAAAGGPAMEKCHFGLTEAAVPVKLGENTLGFLATGQVFTQKPGAEQFEGAMKTLNRMGLAVDRAEARKSFLATRLTSRSQLASAPRPLDVGTAEGRARRMVRIRSSRAAEQQSGGSGQAARSRRSAARRRCPIG